MTADHEDREMLRRRIVEMLSAPDDAAVERIRAEAESVLLDQCGAQVHYRGLIEFSNICVNDCCYCGIRAGNAAVRRYCLGREEILAAARWCAGEGYGSVVLQSGERRDEAFVAFVEACVREIKAATVSARLPRGLGVTLCVGEQSPHTYRRFFDAGAHRYLLRIETSNPELFARIHPPGQCFDDRVACLHALRETGFQVGTGVMIGLPGQTAEDLAEDILFFRDMDVDMIGMGPYIPHGQTPLSQWPDTEGWTPQRRLRAALLMIAAARIILRDVNIAATTALQALDPQGREAGLRFGANVIMPQLTPMEVRRDYLLYDGKPCLDESAAHCRECLERRITAIGRTIGKDQWGDSRHARRRRR